MNHLSSSGRKIVSPAKQPEHPPFVALTTDSAFSQGKHLTEEQLQAIIHHAWAAIGIEVKPFQGADGWTRSTMVNGMPRANVVEFKARK